MSLRVFLPSQQVMTSPCCGFGERVEPAWFRARYARPYFYHPSQMTLPSHFLDDVMELFDHSAPFILKGKEAETKNKKTTSEESSDFSSEFDLTGFDPSEVKVKTIGQKVVVEAKKESKEEKDGCLSYSRNEYHRSIVLPDNVKAEELTSTLNEAGKLRITAPLIPSLKDKDEEREIPVAITDNPTKNDVTETKTVEDANDVADETNNLNETATTDN
uniref:body wall muscle protein HR-29-like n=1 Tax=Ciona intestinalis TaxID=7719 RepID=UPI000180B879|nr:body wall muscle protein HR-29-like [Ciona intestinalis]|eukprot:XP_002128483.1 body wall muscle protein HR-29-like [Ciona intestinalis]